MPKDRGHRSLARTASRANNGSCHHVTSLSDTVEASHTIGLEGHCFNIVQRSRLKPHQDASQSCFPHPFCLDSGNPDMLITELLTYPMGELSYVFRGTLWIVALDNELARHYTWLIATLLLATICWGEMWSNISLIQVVYWFEKLSQWFYPIEAGHGRDCDSIVSRKHAKPLKNWLVPILLVMLRQWSSYGYALMEKMG